jgi:transcriptional regulator with XRE-family HTH domain
MTHSQTVQSHRKGSALTQEEVARLLDVAQTTVSRLELGQPSISLRLACGLQVVFGIQPSIVFSKLYAEIEDAVMRRAAELERTLRAKTDPVSERKRRHLALILERALVTPKGA